MTYYRVRLNGQNFLLNLQGKVKKYGFYTTRDVEAESFEEAELKAVDLVKEDDAIKNSAVNEKDNSPMIYLEEIRILESGEEQLKNSGYSFYTEDETS
jgi:hypothetical protein